MKIIIVDDDCLVAGALKTILEVNEDVEVLATGADGKEACELYERYEPDVLLMDIRMEKMDGLEASRSILSRHPKANILLLTTFSDDEYIVKALRLGAKGYLLKQDYEIYNATLKERNRIAREIHDNVGHVLSRSILMVGAAKTINKDPGMTAILKNLEDSLNHAMNSIRNSVHDLHDEAVNLEEVEKSLVHEFTFCSVQMVYDMTREVPREVKYCFISITKEAFANIMKHSNATKVQLILREHPGLYQLCIEDNGTDAFYDPEKSGIGIVNMKERVNALGGTIQIFTDKGFRIFITIPKCG